MGNICIIGFWVLGKIIYFVGFCYYFEYEGFCSKYIVLFIGIEFYKLKEKVGDIFMEGLFFDGIGNYVYIVDDFNYYCFKIEVKRGFF